MSGAFGRVDYNNGKNESATVGEIMDHECKGAFQLFNQLISSRFLLFSHSISHAVAYDSIFLLHRKSLVATEADGI
jgi:hypothetical protein